jgi:hypothetical protein
VGLVGAEVLGDDEPVLNEEEGKDNVGVEELETECVVLLRVA